MTRTWIAQIIEHAPAPARSLWMRVQASPLGIRLLQGAFWVVFGNAIARGSGLLASILVARSLGKEAFGQFGIIQGTIGMLGVFAGLGLGTTAAKHVAEFRSSDKARVGRILALSSITSWISGGAIAVVLLATAPYLAERALNAPNLSGQLRLAALLLLLGGINGAQTGALSGFEAFRVIARINMLVALLNLPCLAIGASVAGLTGTVCGLVASLLVNCFLNFIHLRRELHRRDITLDWSTFLQELPLLWRFSLPVTLVSTAIVPANWFSSIILTNTPQGYAELGAFTAALQWRNLIVLVPGMLANVAMPMLSHLKGCHDTSNYRRMLLLQLGATSAIASIAALAVALFSRLIAASYGTDFLSATPVIAWMSLSGLLIAVNRVAGTALASLSRPWTGLLFASLCGLTLVLVASTLAPRYGATGLALAHVIAYTLHSLWQGLFLQRTLRHGNRYAI